MAGQSQAANLGGMLSQIGGTIGSMGSAGNALARPLENAFRPEVDPTDIASQQSLMQWQTGMGRTQEAGLTRATIADMERKDKEAKAKENATIKMGLANAYANATDADRKEAIRKRAGELSQELGEDFMSGLYSIDNQERAQTAAKRAQQQYDWAVSDRQRQELDRSSRGQWAATAGDEEARAELVKTLKDAGLTDTITVLQANDFRMEQWDETRRGWTEAKTLRDAPVLSEGGRKVVDSELAALGEINEKLGTRLKEQIETVENDENLSKEARRQKIDGIMRQAQAFNMNNASAEAAAIRRAAAEAADKQELDTPALGLWADEEKSPAAVGIASLYDGWPNVGPWADKDQAALEDALESVDPTDLRRLTAAYLTTYKTLSTKAAAALAVEALSNQVLNLDSIKGANEARGIVTPAQAGGGTAPVMDYNTLK